jgi:hypothetical protein
MTIKFGGGDFGDEEMYSEDPFSPFDPSDLPTHEMTDTAGMPTGPVGTGPGSFGLEGYAGYHGHYPGYNPSIPNGYPMGDYDGAADRMGFDDEFYSGFGPAMIFGCEDANTGVKG